MVNTVKVKDSELWADIQCYGTFEEESWDGTETWSWNGTLYTIEPGEKNTVSLMKFISDNLGLINDRTSLHLYDDKTNKLLSVGCWMQDNILEYIYHYVKGYRITKEDNGEVKQMFIWLEVRS